MNESLYDFLEERGRWRRMSDHMKSSEEQERLETEAVEWIVRLTSGDATARDRHAAAAWRQSSDAHDRAYQKALRVWGHMGALQEAGTGNGQEQQRSSPSIAAQASARPSRQAANRSRKRWLATAAAMAGLALLVAIQFDLRTRLLSDYYTDIGEQSTHELEDGSRVQLNSRAALAIHYTQAEREVRLLNGEAAFRVKKDASRPFVVEAERGLVRAVGTEFLVHRTGAVVTVTVIEGIVEVSATGTDAQRTAPVRLESGQRLRYGSTGIGPVETADLRLATAWQRGKLIFESAPLRLVIDEINRYRPGHLAIVNNDLARHPVSGVFDLQQLDVAVAAIERTIPQQAMHFTSRYILFR